MTTETEKKTNWVVDETVDAVPKTKAEVVDENVKENWFIAFGELAEIEWRHMDHGFIMPGQKNAMRTVIKNGKKVQERYDVFKPKYVSCPATVLRDKTLPESKRYKKGNLTMCGEVPPEGFTGKRLMRWCRAHMAVEHADLYYDMHKGTIAPVCDTQYKVPDNDGRSDAPPQHYVVEFFQWKKDGDKSTAHMTPDDAEVFRAKEEYMDTKEPKAQSDEKKAVAEVKEIIGKGE